MQPKISITIPVYNAGDKIEACLESVINQTLTDIEIICVNDASTDNSPLILKKIAALDNRIIVINHDENKGTLVSRKDAVLKATGKYIMFVDSDDSLESNACEVAYKAITRENVDILRYGINIIVGDYSNMRTVQRYRELHECTYMKIENKNILEACGDNLLLWNKIIAADVCKKGYQSVENFHCLTGEDTYALLLIVSYCNSYAVIEDKIYNYSFGIGIANKKTRTAEEYKAFVETAKVFKNTKKFYEKNNIFEYWEKEYNRILTSHLLNALNEIDISVKQNEQIICLRMMMVEWGEDLVLNHLLLLHNARGKEIHRLNNLLEKRDKELVKIKSSKRWKVVSKVGTFLNHKSTK